MSHGYARAVEIPRGVARFNRRVTNPIQGVYAWLLPPWAVIRHRGRRTGRAHRTPVVGFKRGRRFAVVVLYGERSDWVLNVLAGGGEVVRAGRTYRLGSPRLVAIAEAPADLPPGARLMARLSGKLLVAELEQPDAGGIGSAGEKR